MTKKKNGRGQGATTAIFQAFFIHKEGGRTDGTVQCAANPSISANIFVNTLKRCTPNSIYFKKASAFRVIYYLIFIKNARKSNFFKTFYDNR